MAGPALDSHNDSKMPSAISRRKLWKKKKKELLSLTGPGKHTDTPGTNQKITGRERETMCLGFFFYWGQRVGE